MTNRISRRQFLTTTGLVAAASVFGPYAVRRAFAQGPLVNSAGVTLPADAAPLEKQVLKWPDPMENYITADWWRSNYRLAPGNLFTQEPLVRVDKDLKPLPAGAESWSLSEDGLTWTFKIRKGLVWSDGKPYTANDWVYSFQLGVDPKTAYDFAWYYNLIKNWDEANQGKVPVTAIGVAAPDDYTLQITTTSPKPYVPAWVGFCMPSPAHAEAEYGKDWSMNPKTFISSGPFTLANFEMDKNLTLVLNKNYKGDPKAFLERIEFGPVAQGLYLPAYKQDQINIIGQNYQLDAPDIEVALKDSTLKDQLHPYGHFQTYYVGMNTFLPPFDNLKLRQAVTHAIDRETLATSVLPNLITPAYTMLMKGFPNEHVDKFKDIQNYDPDLAKKLIAEAGFPNGQGVPPLEMWMRGTGAQVNARDKTAAEAVAAMLTQNLGLNISVKPTETQTFNDNLYGKKTLFYFLPYQFDFLDASNLLGIWRSTGRHAWKSQKFDDLLTKADTILNDPAQRDDVFYQMEQTLLEDAPAAFVFHPLNYHMWRPWVVGSDLEPNFAGFRAVVYLNSNVHRTVYINNSINI
jgi:ABC-type oligopeptide transport system substrate-binding subunit